MADLKYALDDNVKQNYLEPLHHLQSKDLKEVSHHRKKLQGRKLDYDCKKRQGVTDKELKQAEDKFAESLHLAQMGKSWIFFFKNCSFTFFLKACSTFSKPTLSKSLSWCSLLRRCSSTTDNAARSCRDFPRLSTPRLRPLAGGKEGNLRPKPLRYASLGSQLLFLTF